MADRMFEGDISGGNCWEAVSRRLNSFSSKPTADSTASKALESSVVLRLLIFRGRLGGFVDEEEGMEFECRCC
jgi:hypothetical protein